MKAIEGRRYEMLVRVREFGETHRDLFPESTLGRQAFERVATAVTQLSKHAVLKMSTTGEGRRGKTAAREALVGRLEAIARTARVIVIGDGAPDLDCFRLPPKLTDHMVLMTGRVFIRHAESFASQFIALGMPPTFLADLTELVDGFEQAIHSREAGRTGQVVARTGMAAAFSAGFAAVRTLDVVVANVLHGDPVTLAGWERDRRVGYPQRKRQPSRRSSAPPIVRLERTA